VKHLYCLVVVALLVTRGFPAGASSLEDDWLRLKVGSSRRIPKRFASAEVEDAVIAEIRRDLLGDCLRIHGLKAGETTVRLTYLDQPRTVTIRVVVQPRVRSRKAARERIGVRIGGWAE